MERRLFLGAVLVFFLSGFFIVINFYYQNTIERPTAGGIFREGLAGQPTFINPLAANANGADWDLIKILFSGLSDLAKNYQVSEDGLSWTITLKENLRWSDGESLTASDVIYTLDIIQDPANNHPLFTTWQGVVAERLNDNEIRLSLKTPYAFLIDNLADLKIAPRHIFSDIPPANFRLSRYNLEPITSGPYKFDNFQTRRDGFVTEYHLMPNEFYFGSQPFIEKIIFKFYENETELVKAFNRKEIDAVAGLDQKSLKELRVAHRTVTINLPRYYAIFFNPNIHPALKSEKVRRALALAINKEKIVKEIFNDQTIIMNGPLPPNIDGYDRLIYQNDKFDPKAADSLLDQARWTKNNDGVRMEISLIVPQIYFLMETAERIRTDWEKIGVKLNLVILNPDDINNSILKARNYEAVIFGNILKKNPDLFSFWHSSERFYPGRNLALYTNRRADDLLEAIRQDFNSESRRKKLSQLQKLINDDQPAIFLFSPNYFYVVPKNLRGFLSYFIATPADRFDKINDWYLKITRKIK